MNYDVTYSLRMALESSIPELNDVQIIYDGVELTSIPKPFATIQYLQGQPDLLAAGRASYNDTYNFQVGLFASDVGERHRLESKMRGVLRKPDGHALYHFDDVIGSFVDTGEKVPFNDNGFTPISSDDNSAETNSHHGYFDVAIAVLT